MENFKETLSQLQSLGKFSISPTEIPMDFGDKTRFSKLQLDENALIQMNNLIQQLPSAIAAGQMSTAYTVKFPEGLPHTLTALKQGGFGSMIQGESGGFVGSASFFPITASAAFLAGFSAISAVTGQYFLNQINSNLTKISLKLDKILEFLYGDKKAELLSEINFIQYAIQSYHSIFSHDEQRIATIIGIQESKKVAVKDIEFYLDDLSKSVGDAETKKIDKVYQIMDSLSLSVQLYVMSCVLEVYYAQNYDAEYLSYVESTVKEYIGKCEKRMSASLGGLKTAIADAKNFKLSKSEKPKHEKKISELIDSLQSSETSPVENLHEALFAPLKPILCYLTEDGSVYAQIE